jgi:MFS family permease
MFQFEKNSTWACAFSILILNYNCALTSYILCFGNTQFLFAENVETWSSVFATLSVVFGLFIGQILFGFIGDTLGTQRTFSWFASIMFLGSFLSLFVGAIPVVSDMTKPLLEFSVFRVILGVGAGGLYPTVSAILRESGDHDMSRTFAFVFGPFGSIGLILAPVLVYTLTLMV